MNTRDDEIADATRVASAVLAGGQRPAWRYLSKVMTYRAWQPAAPQAKQDVDALTEARWGHPVKGRKRGRLYDPRWSGRRA